MTADSVTASVHIDAPPERVYAYFTRPEAIVTWMGEYALLEAEPGGRFELDIKGAPVRGRFLHLDPPHRLLISWGYAGSAQLPPGASTVEVTLTANGGGTLVELEHRDLPPTERPKHAPGWTHYLTRLEAAAPGHHPGPDPGMPSGCPAGSPQLFHTTGAQDSAAPWEVLRDAQLHPARGAARDGCRVTGDLRQPPWLG